MLAAGADVAVVGLGLRGRDAEGDDAALGHGGQAFTAGGAELLDADHHVVGRHRENGLCTLRAGIGRRRRHGRTRIAALRLDHDVDFHADFPGLLLGHETVGIVGRDDRPGEQAAIGHPKQGLVKGRLLAEQRHELLGHAFARQGPQPLAGASDQDDGRDEGHSSAFSSRMSPDDGARYSRRLAAGQWCCPGPGKAGHRLVSAACRPRFSSRRRRASISTASARAGICEAIS